MAADPPCNLASLKAGIAALEARLTAFEKLMEARLTAIDKTIDDREIRSKERLEAMTASINLALGASDKAISKAESATERRFESINEFRAALADQATGFLPRAEYAVQHKALVETANMSAQRITALEGRALGSKEGLGNVGAIAVGVIAGLALLVSLAQAVITLLLRH